MWWFHDGWGWAGWVAMSLSMIVFWGLVAWVVVFAVRSSAGSGRESTPDRTLADRFARGEIDEEEYRRRSAALRAEAGK